jgi:hypothetical protein
MTMTAISRRASVESTIDCVHVLLLVKSAITLAAPVTIAPGGKPVLSAAENDIIVTTITGRRKSEFDDCQQ